MGWTRREAPRNASRYLLRTHRVRRAVERAQGRQAQVSRAGLHNGADRPSWQDVHEVLSTHGAHVDVPVEIALRGPPSLVRHSIAACIVDLGEYPSPTIQSACD